ncbi:hypothetical protein QQ020_05500 [Fulvivirgaceae bacterium BMA12]|uniref:Uncharacterized protein n=1 Tax=Agaribacillus aureus TaxID=3051825 RepID=A0ABT8L4Y4_9BACT|nr:hypothetical protein [Fulvivirgaceae bacterium BMA12]
MGYFTRVFCKANNRPSVKQILDNLNSFGYSVTSNLNPDELESEDWANFELNYKDGKLPILVELNQLENSDGLAEEEIEEFKETIGKPGLFSLSKKKVLTQLEKTKFILCNQLPISDIDDDGYDVNGELMQIFVSECEGMIQCDGEGFYFGTKLILKE